MDRIFEDRAEAGHVLAERLTAYAGLAGTLVLALPRGGVPVGAAVAHALHVPLDIVIVRKLGVPGQEELAMGAIASGQVRVLNVDVVHELGITDAVIDRVARQEQEELERREGSYREGRPAPIVEGKIVILVDDGLATGATMRAAALALRQQLPSRIIAAVPVASVPASVQLRSAVDEVVCVLTPEPFYGVGHWYADFSATTDEEVRKLLRAARRPASSYPNVDV
jgi:putative phosphoribosyl transferase